MGSKSFTAFEKKEVMDFKILPDQSVCKFATHIVNLFMYFKI